MSDYSKDPHVLYAAKKQIIDELLDLDKSPRVLVQTNPPEYSMVGNDCAIDLYGWAEPETKIFVQGRELPISEDGLFMENVRLSRNNTIVVEVENRAYKKTIIRQFGVLY